MCDYTSITDTLETKTELGMTHRKPLDLIRKWAVAFQKATAGAYRLKHLVL